MRCYSVLGARVFEGFRLSDRGDKGVGITLGNELIPIDAEWMRRVRSLVQEEGLRHIPELDNADFAYEQKKVSEDSEGAVFDVCWTHLKRIPKRLDKDGRALVMVRPERSKKGKQVLTTYSSTVFDEVIEGGIIVRRFRDIERGLGISACFRKDQNFVLIMEPGSSFRAYIEGKGVYLLTWRDDKIEVFSQTIEPVKQGRVA